MAAADAYAVECCFKHSQDAFWMPILKSGLHAKDLGLAIKQKFKLEETAEVFVAHPVTCEPLRGREVVLPSQAVRVWVVPKGCQPPRTRAALPVVPPSTPRRNPEVAFLAWLTREPAHAKPSDGATSPDAAAPATLPATDPSDSLDIEIEEMPFYAVRTGRRPGVYFTRSEMLAQTRDFGGADSKAFASLAEATRFVSSPAETATGLVRHAPAVSEEPCGASSSLGTLDCVMASVLEPPSRRGFGLVAVCPSWKWPVEATYRMYPDARSAGRCELLVAVQALQCCAAAPGYVSGITIVRLFSCSTYVTNAVNDYARAALTVSRRNSDVLAELAALLTPMRCTASWSASTSGTMVRACAMLRKFRLNAPKGADPCTVNRAGTGDGEG